MAQTEVNWPFAFIALGTTSRADQKGQNDHRSALPYSHPVGAQVARQRCPILRAGMYSLSPAAQHAKLSAGTPQSDKRSWFLLVPAEGRAGFICVSTLSPIGEICVIGG